MGSKLRAAILVVSDTASRDPSTDKSTEVLSTVFKENSSSTQWTVDQRKIVQDDVLEVQRAITSWTDGKEGDSVVNVIVCTGGTGFARRDITPEVGLFHSISLKERLHTLRTAQRLGLSNRLAHSRSETLEHIVVANMKDRLYLR